MRADARTGISGALELIDCHAHLALPEFDQDRQDVLRRAAEAGVAAIVVVGQDADENEAVLALCRGACGRMAIARGRPGGEGVGRPPGSAAGRPRSPNDRAPGAPARAPSPSGGETAGSAATEGAAAHVNGPEASAGGSPLLPALLPSLGLHPDRWSDGSPEPTAEEIERVRAQIRRQRDAIVAIGEVGLDHYRVRDHERRRAAIAALETLAALAAELDLPLNVHSRSAGRVTLEVLAAAGARRVLMHAFDGNARAAARAAEEHGYLFSIPPSVVRSEQKQRLAAALPPEALALESDSPVLGPERGQRNEPANLCRAAEAIARIRRMDEEAVRELTTANARRLFGPRL